MQVQLRSFQGVYILVFLLSALAWGHVSHANTAAKKAPQKQILAIAAAPLSDALKAFAKQTNIQLLYPAEIVRQSDYSDGLAGEFFPRDALSQLLKPYFIEAIWLNDELVTLRAADKAPEEFLPPLDEAKPERIERIETLVVTGSRIAQPYSDQVFPSLAIDYQSNFRSLNTNVGDTLSQQAIFCSGTQSLNASGLDRNVGASFPDLYCLDSQRTLTLVEGRRWVPSNSSDLLSREPGVQFDINSIPSNMIDRIEIIGLGSSAVYGSDAVAGTVNLLLRDEFDGFEINLEGGTSEQSDGEQLRLAFLAGGTNDSLAAKWQFAYEYYEQKAILAADREFTLQNYTYLPNPQNENANDGIADFIRYADVRSNFSSNFGVPTLRDTLANYLRSDRRDNMIVDADGRPLVFDANGRLRAAELGQQTQVRGLWIGGEGERASDYRNLRSPTQQHKVFANFKADISSSMSAYAQLHYYDAEASTLSDPIRSTSSNLTNFTGLEIFNPRAIARASVSLSTVGRFSGPTGSITSRAIYIPKNPDWFHPDDLDLIPDNGIFVHRTWNDLNDGVSQTNQLMQFYAGLDGTLSTAGVDWDWNLHLGKGQSQSDNFRRNIDCTDSFCSSQFAVRRQGPNIQIPGEITDPAIIDQLSFVDRYRNEQEMTVASALAKSELLSLPAGPLQLSLGLERRIHETRGKSAADIPQGIVQREPDFDDGYDTKEAMIELRIPLLDENSGIPGLDLVGIDSAYRWVSHSTAGADDTYTLGAKARFYLGPAQNDTTLTLRGNRTKSIRSPSTQEVAFPRRLNGRSPDFEDPCNQQQIARADDPVRRREFCIEDAQRRGIDNYNPDTYNDDRVNESIETTLEGNPDLVNEEGRSYSVGALLEFGESFSFSLDRIAIDIMRAPTFPSEEAILLDCYERQQLRACEQIQRRTGPGPAVEPFNITEFNIIRENVGIIRTRLTQYSGLWSFNLNALGLPGGFTLSATGQVLHSYERAERELAGLLTFPKQRLLASLGYTLGNAGLTLSADHIGKTSLVLDDRIELLSNNRVDAYTLYNLAFDYQITQSLLLYAGAKNIFDQDPPGQLQSIDAVNEFAPIGPYYLLGVKLQF